MRCGLVQQVYGLVRQEAVADIAHGKSDGGADGLVGDLQTVVRLQRATKRAEHPDAAGLVRLRHVHGLEAAL